MKTVRLPLFLLLLVAPLLVLRPARAEAPAPELLSRLAAYAETLEKVMTHSTYAMSARVDTIDRRGTASPQQVIRARFENEGETHHMHYLQVIEDGADKTEENERRVLSEERAGKQSEHDALLAKMPFSARRQPLYNFDLRGDTREGGRYVLVGFAPKHATKDTLEGTAWVDVQEGTLVSTAFKMSKPGLFVDFIHVTMEFGARSELGPAPSRMTFEGKGGFLFFVRKHVRGEGEFSDYHLAR